MDDFELELEIGDRVQLSSLGRERCPKLLVHTGTVKGGTNYPNSLKVLFDGRRTPVTIHRNYLERFLAASPSHI